MKYFLNDRLIEQAYTFVFSYVTMKA